MNTSLTVSVKTEYCCLCKGVIAELLYWITLHCTGVLHEAAGVCLVHTSMEQVIFNTANQIITLSHHHRNIDI